MTFCKKCGTRLKTGNSFCTKCGAETVYKHTSATPNRSYVSAASASYTGGGVNTRNPASASSVDIELYDDIYYEEDEMMVKKRSKLPFIILAVVLILAIGFSAACFVVNKKQGSKAPKKEDPPTSSAANCLDAIDKGIKEKNYDLLLSTMPTAYSSYDSDDVEKAFAKAKKYNIDYTTFQHKIRSSRDYDEKELRTYNNKKNKKSGSNATMEAAKEFVIEISAAQDGTTRTWEVKIVVMQMEGKWYALLENGPKAVKK